MVEHRLTIFWISLAVVLVLFAGVLGINIAIWFQGDVYEDGRRVERGKLLSLIRITFRGIFSRHLGTALRAFMLDGVLQRPLFVEDKFRWLGHIWLSLGFFALFALSAFTGFFEEGLHLILGVHTPFVMAVIDKNNPIMALLNEVLGVIILLGVAIIAFRRYVLRPKQLDTGGPDTAIIVLLVILMLTSYPTESFRYLMEGLPVENGWYGFVGYALARLLQPLNWNWEVIHFWSFMIHFWSAAALLLYMPFSKFVHVLVSPLIITINSVAEEMA